MRIPDEGDAAGLESEADTSAVAEAVDRIAHQLKNPLQAMTVNLEVLRLRAGREEREETERVTGVVDQNIRLLDRRVRMLIALARRSPDEPYTGVDLAEEVREAGAAFRLDDREDGLGLSLRIPEDADGGAHSVRAREGQLLALLLAVASAAASGSGGDEPYLAVGGDDGGSWIEVGPGAPWGDAAEGEAIRRQARRSGADVVSPEGDAESPDSGPFRARFPRT